MPKYYKGDYKWLKRQGPNSDIKTDGGVGRSNLQELWHNYQILYGDWNGQTVSAVGWYNIPSTFAEAGQNRNHLSPSDEDTYIITHDQYIHK